MNICHLAILGSLEKYLRLNRNILFNSPNTMLDFSVQVYYNYYIVIRFVNI